MLFSPKNRISPSLSSFAHIVLARIDELKLGLVHRGSDNVWWEHVPGEHHDEDLTEDDDDEVEEDHGDSHNV